MSDEDVIRNLDMLIEYEMFLDSEDTELISGLQDIEGSIEEGILEKSEKQLESGGKK